MKTIRILSRHQSLDEAVKAAGVDLSYNRYSAQQKINDTQNAFGNVANKFVEAFVVEGNKVLFLYSADILLLNEFNPFISCMHDGPFHPVAISDKEIFIHDNLSLPRDQRARHTIRMAKLTVTTL